MGPGNTQGAGITGDAGELGWAGTTGCFMRVFNHVPCNLWHR